MVYFRHLMAYEIFKAEKDKDYPSKLKTSHWKK
jgi:hypothetical protein